MSYKLRKYTICSDMKIRDAISRLNEVEGKGLVISSGSNELLGSLTDGDIRRAIIAGKSLDEEVSSVMHSDPFYVDCSVDLFIIEKLALEKQINVIPILRDGVIVDIFIKGQFSYHDIPVVIMAGGLGTRLGDFTKNCPKPMLEVGGKPILEQIIKRFCEYNFKKFFISVNYLSDVIENYFGTGEKFSCDISYLREEFRLGTAGPLALINESEGGPVVVINGDLITDVDFRQLVHYHKQSNRKVTVGVRDYSFQVPFGVVNHNQNGAIISFDEKPIHNFSVNAGIYVIDSSLLSYIPKNQYYDMSSFLLNMIEEKIALGCFPIVEKWKDIGQIDDLNHARSECICE